MRLPRLLTPALESGGKALRETGRLTPSALSAELSMIPLSRARMTLREDDLPIQVHDFVELFGQNGSLGIFRVNQITTEYARQREVELSHALDVFSDAVILLEQGFSGTVGEALARIIAGQTVQVDGQACWQLGTVEDGAECTVNGTCVNAMQWLTDLAKQEEDYCFAFDFSRFPWVLHFVKQEDAVLSEFRLPRNVENCRVTLDDGKLCTRLYLSVDAEDGSEPACEVYDDAAGQAKWGVICRTAGVKSAETPDRAAWARAYFARHGSPAVQIFISGLELNRLTGERLDEMYLGRICRVALPEYGQVFAERIVCLRYPNLLRDPARVEVSLANRQETAEGTFASLHGQMLASGVRTEKISREVQRNTYSLTAQDRHITAQGEILHKAGLEIDPHGVWLYASEDGPNYALGASFKVQADNITAEVRRATEEEGNLSAQILVQAGRIDLKADQSTVTAQGERLSAAEIAIDGANAAIKLKADQSTVTDLTSRVSQAEIDIDGAEAAIKLKASQSDVTDLTNRVSQAEIDIDGAEAAIALKASQSDVTDLTNRVSQAEIDIDGAEAAIKLKASQSDVTDLTNRVSQAEIDIDGAEAAITLKVAKGDVSTQLAVECGNVTISGGNLRVSGYITTNGLVSTLGSYTHNISSTGTISANKLTGGTLTLDGDDLTSKTITWIDGDITTFAADKQLDLRHYHDFTIEESGGTITITPGAATKTQTPQSFNMADTKFYKDAVSAAKASGASGVTLSGSWDSDELSTSAKWTVTASNSKTKAVSLRLVRETVAGTDQVSLRDGDNYIAARYLMPSTPSYTPVTYARGGLNNFNNGNKATLYYFVGAPGEESSKYRSAGNYYWCWSSGSQSLRTLYEQA